ncbi:glycosyltransferase family 2 protein [Microbacterium memoriense]|uniref:Glycosyltransferase family 2 protein n=1 Tax=Microbacterium memoriense TaxID=2978350 RepID=A0ABT2PIC6_9MICO|nr:glycosyltransferase family 2 protein [Microbacterium memoriense]MCT9003298.1 glycosyltransferase family 2 protein [Microbacterium memoriense]
MSMNRVMRPMMLGVEEVPAGEGRSMSGELKLEDSPVDEGLPSSHVMTLVSVAMPVYNEEAGIEAFHMELMRVVSQIDRDYAFEFIYVNDGSRDRSLEVLKGIAAEDSRVTVVDLSRNYGHQVAITAAIDRCVGDAVIVMDSDLQDPPAVIPELIEAWEAGADVAYAQRRSRQDSAIKKLTAYWYYRLLDVLSDTKIPADTGDFRLMSRRVVDALAEYREANRYIRGIVASLGYNQVAVPFDRAARVTGETAYTWRRMISLASDGVLGFSSKPLRLISRTGFVIAALSALIGLYAIFVRLFFPEVIVQGWAFLATGMFFLGGIQLVMLGIVGAYVGRIYTEVQRRPRYLLQSVYRAVNDDGTRHASVIPESSAQG